MYTCMIYQHIDHVYICIQQVIIISIFMLNKKHKDIMWCNIKGLLTGNKLGVPNRPRLYKTKPSRLIGPRTGRPIKPHREQPSLLSERV